MLMPFQPYRDLGPAEEMASQRRARPVAVDAYRRGDELKAELDLPGADPGSMIKQVADDRHCKEQTDGPGEEDSKPASIPRLESPLGNIIEVLLSVAVQWNRAGRGNVAAVLKATPRHRKHPVATSACRAHRRANRERPVPASRQ